MHVHIFLQIWKLTKSYWWFPLEQPRLWPLKNLHRTSQGKWPFLSGNIWAPFIPWMYEKTHVKSLKCCGIPQNKRIVIVKFFCSVCYNNIWEMSFFHCFKRKNRFIIYFKVQWPVSMKCLTWAVKHYLHPVSIIIISKNLKDLNVSEVLPCQFCFHFWYCPVSVSPLFSFHGGKSWVAWCLKAGVSDLLWTILKEVLLSSLSQTSGTGPHSILSMRSNFLMSDFALQWRHVAADLMADQNFQLNCWWIKSPLLVPDLLSSCKFCPS